MGDFNSIPQSWTHLFMLHGWQDDRFVCLFVVPVAIVVGFIVSFYFCCLMVDSSQVFVVG